MINKVTVFSAAAAATFQKERKKKLDGVSETIIKRSN
jgi:hypothetical protein